MDRSGAAHAPSTCRLLWAVMLLACSCSSDPSSLWVGLYDLDGNQSTVCGATSTTASLSGSVNLIYGSSTGVFVSSINGCKLQWNADDTTATLEKGQACDVSVDGSMKAVMFSIGTATLTGSVVTLESAGSAADGCAVKQQAKLTLVPIRWCRRNECGYLSVSSDGGND
jgi:hypothetical protein